VFLLRYRKNLIRT